MLTSPNPATDSITTAPPEEIDGRDAPIFSSQDANLFKNLLRGARAHRAVLDRQPPLPASTGATREPIRYREPEDVVSLVLDWAGSVQDQPELLHDCLLATARITGYDLHTLQSDLQRSGGLAFTLITVYTSAVCAGDAGRSINYARRCLDILEGELISQISLQADGRRVHHSRPTGGDECSDADGDQASDSSSPSSSSSSDSDSSNSSDSDSKPSKKKSRRSSSRGNRNPPSSATLATTASSNSVEQLLSAILAKQSTASLVATPPAPWVAGEPPKGGYYLETFTRVYRDFTRFVRVYGKHTSVTFKSLIGDDIEPQVRSECRLSDANYRKISDEDLLDLIKSRLAFKEKDYYLAQLEQLCLPNPPVTSLKLYSAFTKLTTDMLRIEDEALQNDVKINKHSLKNIFAKLVKSHYRLQSWFQAKKFKSLAKSVRYINGKIKKRMVDEKEREHELRMDHATLGGVRHDHQGGRQEASEAPSGGRGGGRGGRGGRSGSRGGVTSPRGGIGKRGGRSDGDRGARDQPRTPDEKARLDAAYAAEKTLPKGRFYHKPGPYCFNGPDGKCLGRVCQGCGFHSSAENPGHERPRCRKSSHPDFVPSPKYWCEVWPGRVHPIGFQPRDPGKSTPPSNPHSTPAKVNGVGEGGSQ